MGNSRTRAEELQQLVDSNPSGLPTTKVTLDAQDWHEKFADKFTDQIVSTDTSYTSPNLSIQLTYGSYQTGWITRKTAIMKNTVQIFLMFWPISM